MAKRLQAMGQPNYANGFKVTAHQHMLNIPLKWKKPQTIFVNSMGDLFHEDIPLSFILSVFDLIRRAPIHTFQLLTKRSDRLAALTTKLDWPPNLWMGVSVENSDYIYRINHLRQTGAHVKFLSLEPLLGPLSGLNLQGIAWVIVGGESGPHARPIQQDWVINIREQCTRSEVPFFFKQWGGTDKKKNGRLLEGRIWNEFPALSPAPA
jgi:protein gp37